MTTPICPQHGTTRIRENNGSYYCATRVGDGWCKWKPDDSRPPASQPIAISKIEVPLPKMPQDARIIAALDFAGRLYNGCGPSGGTDEALVCAREALKLFGG